MGTEAPDLVQSRCLISISCQCGCHLSTGCIDRPPLLSVGFSRSLLECIESCTYVTCELSLTRYMYVKRDGSRDFILVRCEQLELWCLALSIDTCCVMLCYVILYCAMLSDDMCDAWYSVYAYIVCMHV